MGWNDVLSDAKNNDRTPITSFAVGNTMIRVLDDEPISFWNHWINKTKTSVRCMGKECPICNVIAQMKAQNVPKNEIPYSNNKRHMIRIWNYTTNQMEVLMQGKTFFSNLLDLHKEVGDITTYDIKVVRKGSDLDTTYTLIPGKVEEFMHKDQVANINIDEMFSAPEKEIMLQLMEGKTWADITKKDEETEN